MFCASATAAARLDLGVTGDILGQQLSVFKIDVIDLFLAKVTVLLGGQVVPREGVLFAGFFM